MNRLITVLFVLSAVTTSAQRLGVEIKSGYSTYSMHQLREFQRLQTTTPLPLKVTNDFEGSINGGFNIYYRFREEVETGIDFSHHKALGRVQYRDYSGQIGIDQTAVANAVSMFTRANLWQAKRFSLKASVGLGLWFTTVTFKQYLSLGDDWDITELSVVANNIGVMGGLEPVYHFNDILYMGLKVGGMAEVARPLHIKNQRDAILQDSNGDEVHAHWAGLRTEFYLGVRLPGT